MIPTGFHTGESFVNNCEIMFSELLNCSFADCDMQGKPLKEKYMVFNRGRGHWKSATVTEEFILNVPVKEIISFVDRTIKI